MKLVKLATLQAIDWAAAIAEHDVSRAEIVARAGAILRHWRRGSPRWVQPRSRLAAGTAFRAVSHFTGARPRRDRAFVVFDSAALATSRQWRRLYAPDVGYTRHNTPASVANRAQRRGRLGD